MSRARRMAAGLLVVLALGALAGSSASAKSSKPTVELEANGLPLAPGAPFVAYSSNFTVSNKAWNVQCSETILTGTIEENGQPSGNAAPVVKASFAGGDQKDEELCKSKFDFVVSYIPEQTSQFTFSAKGDAELTTPRFKLEPVEDLEKKGGHEAYSCVVEKKKADLKGPFPLSEAAQPLVVTFTEESMKMAPNAGSECGRGPGKNPVLSATFTFTSEGSPIEVVREK